MFLSDLALRFLGIQANRDIPHGKTLFMKLIDRAQFWIGVVAGNLDHRFYDAPEILEAFRRANSRGVKIEIIHGPNLDEKSQGILKLDREGIVRLYRFPERPQNHFVVVDEKHVKVEDFHLQDQPVRQAYIKTNTIYLAKKLTIRFAHMKSQSVREEREVA